MEFPHAVKGIRTPSMAIAGPGARLPLSVLFQYAVPTDAPSGAHFHLSWRPCANLATPLPGASL